jgi:hypothetical protein
MGMGELTKVTNTTAGIHWETLLNINLNVKNEKQDYNIGIVNGGTSGWGKGEWRRWRWGYTCEWIHILIQNRTKKPVVIALSGFGRELRGRNDGAM